MMFGAQARIPSELIVGPPEIHPSPSCFAYSRASKLTLAYQSACEHLQTSQKRSKDYYDLGANQRVFQIGDQVRIRLKAIAKSAGKLLSKWSDLYEVVSVRGVVVELRDPKT